MTSAPKSPSNWPQNGPASNVPSSSTRNPVSGPAWKPSAGLVIDLPEKRDEGL